MRALWKASAIALLGLVTILPAASARPRAVVRSGVYVPYAPYWGAAYVNPGPNSGTLKINIPLRIDATIYVDGQFVGMTPHVENVAVTPGTHSVEVRDPDGYVLYLNNVTVAHGMTTEVQPLSQPTNQIS
jgi:hypothetical protein